MDLSNKTTKIGIGLLALLLIAGLTLFYSGSDAVACMALMSSNMSRTG